MSRRPPSRGRRPGKANDRDYYGPTSHSDAPRKRQRPRSKPVFVVDIRVPFEEIADFMNRVMQVEGFTRHRNDNKGRSRDPDGDEVHVGDAVVGFTRRGDMWCVEAATDALADKLCYMNRMPFNDTILRVSPDRQIPDSECKYSCWNEYYFSRYKENDNVLDKEVIVHVANANMEGQRLLDLLNEKMKFYGLCELHDRESILLIRGMVSFKSFVLTMSTPVEADRLCFLNGIQLGNTAVAIERSKDWIGPKPHFRNYLEFLRSRSESNAKRREHQMPNGKSSEPEKADVLEPSSSREPSKRNPQSRRRPHAPPNGKSSEPKRSSKQQHPPTEAIELASDSDDDEVQIVEEHEEAKKLEKENKHLRTVLNAMKHSNDTKAKEIISLMSQLHDLETKVSDKKSEASAQQEAESNLKNEIDIAQEKVTAIHDSWQAQALVLAEKQQQIDRTQQQLTQLSGDVQNVEASLLDERNECQGLETILRRFASDPSSLAVVKKQQREDSSSDTKVAASNDAFDV